DQLVARRHEVGLDQVVIVLHPAVVVVISTGRAARAVGRHRVIGPGVGAEGVGRADRDHRRVVTGRVNRAVDLLPLRILAVVAGGAHHHDAGVVGAAGGQTEWVELIAVSGDR